jgi:hypothetical protein
LFGKVTSGNYANVPTIGGINGDIYIVSGDGNASNNGRTFIKDDTNWNEVSPNTASTDARYLRLGGGTMEGVLTIPTGKALILTDAPTGSTDAANKGYVDAKSAAAAPDATSSVSGKIKLAGDLGGTYDSPSVPGLAAKAPIESPTFTGTVRGITKTMVGLENVENTSDANKPVSDATLTALNLKAPIASPTFSGTATFTGNVSGITATMVGLGNVTNKSEADLAISNATATALSAKENSANKSTATDLGATNASHDKYPSQLAVKTYVDASLSSGAPDADGLTKGKVQLAGDLTGTAALPSIATSAITSAKIADGTIANDDISSSAEISDSKLAEIKSSGKVNNSATTATAGNTASAIVARDANRDFSAGTITANLTGNVTGNAATATKLAATKNINGVAFDGSSDITVTAAASTLTGTSLNSTVTGSSLTSVGTLTDLTVTNAITGSVTGTAANVTGTVAVANGGTGTSTASPNVVFAGPTSGSTTAAPSFRALVAADIPTLNQNTTGNASTATTAGNITATSNTTLTSLSNLNTVGTITAGTWSGTAIAVEKGGTGSTTALGALTNLGAAPAAGSSSITTVGTITTGTWSGTAIAVEKGGTGSTTALGALTNLGAAPAAGSTSIATVGTINTGTWQGSAIGVGYGGTGSSTATPNHVFAGPATGTTATAPSYRALVGADIPDATETAKGGVSITTQTFAGNKTFTGKIKATNYITTVPALTQATTAATSIDMSTGNIFQINLRANTTVSLTNLSPGTYLFEVIQNGNGAGLPFYNGTWPAWKWSGGAAPTITTTYGKIDVITLVYDGAFYLASAVQNF